MLLKVKDTLDHDIVVQFPVTIVVVHFELRVLKSEIALWLLRLELLCLWILVLAALLQAFASFVGLPSRLLLAKGGEFAINLITLRFNTWVSLYTLQRSGDDRQNGRDRVGRMVPFLHIYVSCRTALGRHITVRGG